MPRTPPVGRKWVKGQSGNPNGRPKAKILSDELRALLKMLAPGTQITNAQLVARNLLDLAITGNPLAVQAARLLFEYTEGKPTQPVTFDLDQAAERLAAEHGIDKRRLIDLARYAAERQAS